MIHPNITLFLVLTTLKRPLHAIILKKIKKQASHQNADLIFLANFLNFEIEMSSMRWHFYLNMRTSTQYAYIYIKNYIIHYY